MLECGWQSGIWKVGMLNMVLKDRSQTIWQNSEEVPRETNEYPLVAVGKGEGLGKAGWQTVAFWAEIS